MALVFILPLVLAETVNENSTKLMSLSSLSTNSRFTEESVRILSTEKELTA
jgi:hypothetical protein